MRKLQSHKLIHIKSCLIQFILLQLFLLPIIYVIEIAVHYKQIKFFK